ncbi:MAG: hypothetical protein RMI49_03195 [Candidatus Caldarchaeum sp.]|nr:hypothetical protein [Candidatus Caldarchaeum sp.]
MKRGWAVLFSLLFIIGSVSGFDQSLVKDVLRQDLEYLKNMVDAKEETLPLRALALTGLFAANIHMGLGDAESLQILNKVAARVAEKVAAQEEIDLGFTGKVVSFQNLLTHLQVGGMAAVHYGLTKSEASREVMAKVGRSLEESFGWHPVHSEAGLVIQSARISLTAGGRPNREDIEQAVKSYSENIEKTIMLSSMSSAQLVQSLSVLSNLLYVAKASDVDVPVELHALWRVHVDYVLNYSLTLVPSEFMTASITLSALVDAAENIHDPYSSKAFEAAVTLAKKLEPFYAVGDRLLIQKLNQAEILSYDPEASIDEISTAFRSGSMISGVDLRYPLSIARLNKIASLDSDVLGLVVSKIATIDGYYLLLEKGGVVSEEFVNRFLRSGFLSTVLALEGAPSARLRNVVVEQLISSYPVSVSVLALLVLLAVLNKVGLLYKHG